MALVFKKASVSTKLKAVLIGTSGSGKSFAIGTLPGTTLILHSRGEEHGISSASVSSDNILHSCIDLREEIDDECKECKKIPLGGNLPPDVAVGKLRRLLGAELEVDNLALDSITDLDLLFRRTNEFDNKTKTDKGYHNTYRESPVVLEFFREIFDMLSDHHRAGKNVVCTLAARVRDKDQQGKASDFVPMLTTFGVAEDIPRAFPQVLVVDEVELEIEGKMERRHAFVFDVGVQRDSKDQNGVVKKMVNFNPRIAGVSDYDLPSVMANDLGKVLRLLNKEE